MKYYVVLFKKFNNYFNRIIKGYDTIAEYEADVGTGNYYHYASEINYNPADNVSTELIMNDCPFDADYLIYYDDDEEIVSRWFILETVKMRNGQYKHSLRRDVIYEFHEELLDSPVYIQKAYLQDDDPFIFNDEGMSLNQIKTEETLLKDQTGSAWVVAYVAKDTLDGGVSIQVPKESVTMQKNLNDLASELGISESDLASIFDGGTKRYINKVTLKAWVNYVDMTNQEAYMSYVCDGDLTFDHYQQGFTNHNPVSDCIAKLDPQRRDDTILFVYNAKGANTAGNIWSTAVQTYKAQLKNAWQTLTGYKHLSYSMFQKLLKYANDKTPIYVNGSLKRISINVISTDIMNHSIVATSSPFSDIVTKFYNDYNSVATYLNISNLRDLDTSGKFFAINSNGGNFTATLEDITDTSDIPAIECSLSTTRNSLQDQVYDMFVIPFNNTQATDGSNYYDLTGENSIRIMQEFVKTMTSKVIYDIQLLPYCPMPEVVASGLIRIDKLTEHYDFDFITRTNGRLSETYAVENSDYIIITGPGIVKGTYAWTPSLTDASVPPNIEFTYELFNPAAALSVNVTNVGNTWTIEIEAEDSDALYSVKPTLKVDYDSTRTVIENIVLYPKKASFQVNISKSLSLKDSIKVESQCNKYRVVSPNYQGSFDFNVAKNGGSCEGFIAECTYKPYVPYIKVVPQLSGLYGGNYGDARGLICGGDFSLGRVNSAWEEYQLNNKNYQNIFNREIQSLDLEQSIAYRNQAISSAVGILTGGGAGAVGGAAASGSWIGAVVGGVAGTAGSAVGAGIDIDTLARQQKDARNLAIDKFNYQLGNIKALPYTLTKVSAFDINSKIWPFLEYYTCTDKEKEALENKIAYESMTVMRIGTFGEFYQIYDTPRYFKGELIRNTEIAEDNHIFEAIYAELLKGVYI